MNEQIDDVLRTYEKCMHLKIFVDGADDLRQIYYHSAKKHNEKVVSNKYHVDAGFDLFAPMSIRSYESSNFLLKIDFNISCSAEMHCDTGKSFNTGYYMYPRSSLSKTPLRLANSTGIIDAGYRGHIIGMFDVIDRDSVSHEGLVKIHDRLVQICAPSLVPILVEVVDFKEDLGEETERGNGGFGSTGRGVRK